MTTDLPLAPKYIVAGAILAAAIVIKWNHSRKRPYLPPCDARRFLAQWGPCWVKERKRDGFHTGIDFAVNYGAKVRAAMAGTVEYAGHDDDRASGGGYGIKVDIRHSDGTMTRYAHLKGHDRGISAGVQVMAGEVIGYAGASGHTKSRPRLHFEIRGPDGMHKDPMKLIRW